MCRLCNSCAAANICARPVQEAETRPIADVGAPLATPGAQATSHSLIGETGERALGTNHGPDKSDDGRDHRPGEAQPELCLHARGARRPTFAAALIRPLPSNLFLFACPEELQGRA